MAKSGEEMKVVKGLDVARYMGRWYEIASFPSFFQPRNGRDTRATYTLNASGSTIHVLNETWCDGKRSSIEGSAYKAVQGSDEAKLKVKFYVPPFLPLFPVVGDYWVLYVDEDYQYAVIGQPSRKSLWEKEKAEVGKGGSNCWFGNGEDQAAGSITEMNLYVVTNAGSQTTRTGRLAAKQAGMALERRKETDLESEGGGGWGGCGVRHG